MDASLKELLVTGAAGMGVTLDDGAVMRFSKYLKLLQEWGSKINLTSRLTGEEIVIYHFLDSLAGAPIVMSSPCGPMVDLGAGAGLPSLPLKFVIPDLRLQIVESVRKKVAFCQQVIRSTEIDGAEAVWGRGEELGIRSEHHHKYRWVVSRALGRATEVAQMALPFLAPGGSVLLYKGEPEAAELRDLELFSDRNGGSLEMRSVSIPHLKGSRSLIVVRFPGIASATG